MLGAVPEVRMMVPPKGTVQLWAWIQRTDDSSWWACLGWVAIHNDQHILCTGYAPPAYLRKRHDADYSRAPRLQLRGQPSSWPPPAPLIGDYRWPGPHHHYGQLDGRDLEPPVPAQRSACW